MRTRLSLALIAALVTVAMTSPAARTQPAASQYATILSSVYKSDQPGAAALVAKGDEIVFLGAAGMADLELAVPLAPDMVFEIGSITKQFTAAAIMLLSEEGKLAVSDAMTRHLPSYPSYGQNITVEHLLTHTSGIVSYTGIPGYMASKVRNDVTVQQLIDVFKDLPVEFAPGERYAYNNSGYILLGAIVEAASGMRYQDFVRKRFFEPLGMKTAHYGCSTCIIPRRASGYDGGPNAFTNQRFLSFTQPYAAGSLMMTVSDLHRWSRALFGGKVVSGASLKRMTTPYVLKNGEPTGYGYGLSIANLRGRRAIRHGGGIFGFVTDALYLPDQDVFVAVFSNNAAGGINPGLPASKLAALAVGDPFPEFTEVALPEDVLRRYVGVYEISKDARRTVTLRDGALYTQRAGGAPTRATPASPTRFFYRTSLSYFDFVVEDGRASAMVMYQDGSAQGERAVRVSDGAAGAADLAPQAQEAATALEGVRVIVGDGRAPIENATIVISAGRIAQLGPSASVRLPAGAVRVNLAGKTVMPTIVDTHVHLSTAREALLTDLRRRAHFGVGAAMSLGLDPPGDAFRVRTEAPAGVARYFTAGRGMTLPEPGRSEVPYWVTTEAEARQAVRDQAALQVDFIKVWVDDREGKYKKMPPAIYAAVIDEAHKAKLRVAAHIYNLADAKGLLQAGIDAFAHGIRDVDVDDELVALIRARKQVVLIPNMPDRGVAADYSWLKGTVPDAELSKIQAASTDRPQAQAAWGIQARNLKRLSDAGVMIALGTDGNTAWAPHVEMADMVAAGMTPMQVIVAATRNGAEFLRMTDSGIIATGKSADLLVLDGNPAEDITNTRRINAVYLKGVKVER